MKGFVGFLVGVIGLCFFASISILVPMTMPRRGDSMVVLLFMLVSAFAFLNVMVVGFYRMLAGLHESALFPDDSYYYPLRGRVLFFIGYIGLLATFGLALFLAILPELMRFRVGRDSFEALLAMCWFIGWIFFGLTLGGVLAMLRDLHQKLYLGGGARSRRYEDEDDLDIGPRSHRPRLRRDDRDERDDRDDRPPRRVPVDDDDRTDAQPRPWDDERAV